MDGTPNLILLDPCPHKCNNGSDSNIQTANKLLGESSRSHQSNKGEDLISLMDDCFISPQRDPKKDKEKQIAGFQIKMVDEFLSTTSSAREQKTEYNFTPERKAEFQRFCDIYEFNLKSKITENRKEEPYLSNNYLNKDVPITQKVLVPKLEEHNFCDKCASHLNSKIVKNRRINHYLTNNDIKKDVLDIKKELVPKLEEHNVNDDLNLNEDLIDELILEKNLEKQYLQNPCNRYNSHDEEIEVCVDTNTFRSTNNFEAISNYSQIGKESYREESRIMNEILIKNKISYLTALTIDDKPHPQSKAINNSNFTSLTVLKNNFNADKDDSHKSSCNENVKINKLVKKLNIGYLEVIKMDEKTFQKRCMLKPEAEKIYLTPGPALFEKSVVLPQIMQRLSSKKKSLEESKGVRRRLILDDGSSTATPIQDKKYIETDLNFISNLVKVEQRERNKSSTKLSLDTNCEANHLRNMVDINERFKHHDGLLNNDHKDLKQNLNIPQAEACKYSDTSLNNNLSSRLDDIPVLRPPQVLISDCNKERLVAYQTSRLFQEFIHSAK